MSWLELLLLSDPLPAPFARDTPLLPAVKLLPSAKISSSERENATASALATRTSDPSSAHLNSNDAPEAMSGAGAVPQGRQPSEVRTSALAPPTPPERTPQGDQIRMDRTHCGVDSVKWTHWKGSGHDCQ